MGGKLDTTSNFLDLFLYAAGESEVPRQFIFWAGMSLLAACVADRVWLEPDRGRRLVPNLYVFLLGPSGSGKEVAISMAGKYATQVPTINLFSGAATSQYLLKHLAKKHKVQGGWEYVNTKLYFLTEELAMATRPGEQAHDLVTTMTGLYKGAPYPFRKGTVTGDDFVIPNPCLTGDVEVLTPKGWIRLDTLQSGEPIMQWDAGICSWVDPEIVRVPFHGVLLGWQEELHHCVYTPDHRIPVTSGRDGRFVKSRTAQSCWDVGEFQIPTAGAYAGGKRHAPELLRLAAAVQADGCIVDGYIQFLLTTPRKIARLRDLLSRMEIDGHERAIASRGRTSFSIYAKDAKAVIELLGTPKRFGPWLLDFEYVSLEAFIDELVWWDGHESRSGGARNGYSSKFFENASWVATVAHLVGRSAYIKQRPTAWYVTIRRQNKTTLYRKHRIEQSHTGDVYCLKVPSSYFLIRSRGQITVTGNCLNWLAGSTDDWLVKTIGRDAVMGGFTARLVTVRGRRNYAQRYPQMLFPEDLEEVRDHLHARVNAYTRIQGGFTIGDEARAIHDTWYLERPAPAEETEEPGFNKSDEMVLRFATLLALADLDVIEFVHAPEEDPGELHLVIEAHHMREAIDIWEGISAGWMPEVIKLASSTQRTSAVDIVQRICAKFGTIDRSALVRKVHGHGLDSDELDRCLRTLEAQERIQLTRQKGERGPPKTFLTWIGEED